MHNLLCELCFRQLAEAGAHVVMAVRNIKAAHELIQQWQTKWSASGEGLPLNIQVKFLINIYIIMAIFNFFLDKKYLNNPSNLSKVLNKKLYEENFCFVRESIRKYFQPLVKFSGKCQNETICERMDKVV